ncbi:hypothetical protein C0993_008018 [Termitomyces sp. T159_Od127]|nr:hypothetical protein C0993_008018 [Termitomyces sp. T159_Od127]
MFQVASHPTAFDLHSYAHAPRRPSVPSPSLVPAVQLPRTLARPPFAEVSRDAIAAAAPELADIPAEYIRTGLRSKANEMLAGISALSHMPGSMPRSRLPRSLNIPLKTTSSEPSHPTHVLAVTSSKNPSDMATLLPVHSLVLASYCAHLPRLPSSQQDPQSPTLHLPVLPLSLPSPAAFSVLLSFMYHHRLEAVLKALFPMPTGFLQSLSHDTVKAALASGPVLHQLSSYLCSSTSANPQTLTIHAAHVKELWQTMVALGLHDPELWDTIDLAWEVILGAFNLAAAQ